MSLRTRLLLLSLLTLVLPWAGCQYARQMETVLRQGQEEALLTTARTLARVVATDADLLYSDPELISSFDPAHGDLFAIELQTPPLVDGFADEWPLPTRALPAGADNPSAPRIGIYGQALYAFLRIRAADIAYENPAEENSRADRVVLLGRNEDGTEQAWCISAVAPGPVIARRCQRGIPWRPTSAPVPDIAGTWRATDAGYDVELRIPLRLLGRRLSLFALHDGVARNGDLGRLHLASPALRARLQVYAPDGLRISVVDARGWLLARAGSVLTRSKPPSSAPEPQEDRWLQGLYRGLLGRTERISMPYGWPYGLWGEPVDQARAGRDSAAWFEPANGEPSTVRAAVPLLSGGTVIGAVMVEQAGDRLLLLRDSALTQLLNFTFMATSIAVLGTLAFAAWLLRRIRRLSRATATALSPEGRIEVRIPDTDARHELGDLARSFATLLGRLKEYTGYLQTLGAKLSHEFRTPLAIVSSSLDNLGAGNLPDEARVYLTRAREGSARLHAILTAMTEATRVEQSIEQAERVEFDLAALLRGAGESYRQTFTAHEIDVQVPSACRLSGSPELIAQLLDKLMDNAADFAPPGGRICLALDVGQKSCRLSVTNDGPLLAPGLEDKLFESLVSSRSTNETRPHLGLGLYIARLIAEFHGGTVSATNRTDAAGVTITIQLPRLQ